MKYRLPPIEKCHAFYPEDGNGPEMCPFTDKPCAGLGRGDCPAIPEPEEKEFVVEPPTLRPKGKYYVDDRDISPLMTRITPTTQAAEEIYKMYPSKRADGQPTGKSRKHKEKIAKLLKQNVPLREILTLYLRVKDPRYIPNLGTFLNNVPDLEELKETDFTERMPKL